MNAEQMRHPSPVPIARESPRRPACADTRTSLYSGRLRRPACAGTRTSLYSGFSLLEVLVALLLMSLALVALVRLSTLEAQATAHLRDTTLAQWVAANALAETRLRDGFPGIGRSEGEATMGGQRWRWQLDVSATDEVSIRRMEVQVRRADDDEDASHLIALTGFATQR